MNTYKQKIEDKRERMLAAADRAEGRANVAYGQADMREESSGIPFGQPILVGHHSEGRHRAAIKRADNAMRKSVEESRRAADLRQRAESVGTGGISSDDPEAIAKLTAKLEELQRLQDFMKCANKIIKPAFKKGIVGPESAGFAAYVETLRAIQGGERYTDDRAAAALVPSWGSHVGFESFQLTNNNAKIKSTKDRISILERAQGEVSQSKQITDDCKLLWNAEVNRVQFIFKGKPDVETRAILKSHGFRWAPSQTAWQRQLTNAGKYAGQQVQKKLTA